MIPDCPVYDQQLVRLAIGQLEHWNGKALDELAIQGMLDAIYEGSLGIQWENGVRVAMAQFESEILRSCRPFVEADDAMKKMFRDLFDGFDVLPLQFREEYKKLLQSEPELAGGLLVPISSRQLRGLRQAVEWIDNLAVVDRPYSAEYGLETRLKPSEDSI